VSVKPIKKLLIANRGEIAVRIIRACRERGIDTVAVYSDADVQSEHVRLASEAVRIGPPPSAQSYLKIDAIVDAARQSLADAVHPGYGFLSENSKFAAACVEAGLTWIGPPAEVIARMGSKVEARRTMTAAGVPVVPGEAPADQSNEGLRAAVDRVGLPVLIKASAGGGGKGMRQVVAADETLEAIEAARREAQSAFGDGTLYVERLIERAHHVEVQVIADARGSTVHLFERECSAQRRHQKVIEECRAPSITAELRDRIAAAGVAAARAVGYRNAGTVEFLADPAAGTFYFLEMNTRLQVEHPVTEAVVGVDLVHAQIDVAEGRPLPWTQNDLSARGHAIEARVYAEDADRGFLPQSGRLLRYVEPRMPGVRVDGGFKEGSEISVHYDPLIAKVIAYGEIRELAIARLREALANFVILGVRTNLNFLQRILRQRLFEQGRIDIGYLDREATALKADDSIPIPSEIVEAMSTARRSSGAGMSTGPASQGQAARSIWDPWNAAASPANVIVARDARNVWAWSHGNIYVQSIGSVSATARPAVPASTAAGADSSTDSSVRRATARQSTSDSAPVLTAPMPGTVSRILVAVGDRVSKGDTLAIMEAMKMELPVRALDDGMVAAIHAREGQLVDADAPLVELTTAPGDARLQSGS
jgi:acetyl-CoA carboxylase biotin carboxylase subunit